MKISTFVIIAIWLFVVGGNVVSVFAGRGDAFQRAPTLPWFIVFMPLIVIFGAYRARGIPGEDTVLERVVDQRAGSGTYRSLMQALRPELMFSAMCLGIVVSTVARQAMFGVPSLSPPILGFFASGCVAFLIAHFIRKSREAQ